MTTHSETLPRRGRTRAPRRSLRALRLIPAVIIAALAAALAVFHTAFRSAEASLAGAVTDVFVERGSFSSGETYFVWIGSTHLLGVQVTLECTALVILIPLLLIAAAMYAATRISLLRTIIAIVVMTVVVMLTNVLRLFLIAGASQWWGYDLGFPLMHTFVGSVIAIIGFAAGLAVLVVVMSTKRRARTEV